MLPTRPANIHLVAELEARIVGSARFEVGGERPRYEGRLGMSGHDQLTRQSTGTALLIALLDVADNRLDLRRL